MNFLLGSSPVTSQLHQIRRHSLACGAFRLNAPLVMQSIKPRSWRVTVLPGHGGADRLAQGFSTEEIAALRQVLQYPNLNPSARKSWAAF
jgi:hypothetical protein